VLEAVHLNAQLRLQLLHHEPRQHERNHAQGPIIRDSAIDRP
jgi:hypothetical protein